MRILPPSFALSIPVTFALSTAPVTAQLEHAPAPRKIGERTAVPIDIQKLEGTLVFDVAKQRATAEATLRFKAGKTDGTPVFDLRQEIRSATLDGKKIDPAKMAAYEFGKLTGTMRILDVELEAGSEHVMQFEYDVVKASSPQGKGPKWSEDGVHWDIWASDLNQGRYLEQWFPANLIYDQHAFDLTIQIVGAGEDQTHELVTNGKVESLGDKHWKVSYPAHFTAFSPLAVLIPASQVDRSQKKVKLKNGQSIEVDVCRLLERARVDLDQVHAATVEALEDFTTHMGPWPHGDRCTVFVWSGGRSMEYDGATTTSFGALRHELFHSYFGRGLKPSSQNGGWWDEAFTVYFLGKLRQMQSPNPARRGRAARGARLAGKVALSPADPWNRVTPGASYGTGAWFFSQVAEVIGEKELQTAMSEIFKANAPNPISTAQLEKHLLASAGDEKEKVKELFDRVVYARGLQERR